MFECKEHILFKWLTFFAGVFKGISQIKGNHNVIGILLVGVHNFFGLQPPSPRIFTRYMMGHCMDIIWFYLSQLMIRLVRVPMPWVPNMMMKFHLGDNHLLWKKQSGMAVRQVWWGFKNQQQNMMRTRKKW